MPTFTIRGDEFVLGDQPFQVISGSVHYFRVHPDQWRDRLEKAVAMGLNTVDTYVAWNFHSSARGEFRTDGWRDLGAFLDLAADLGLHAIVRPGPYICAEWTNGGLPTWLTASGVAIRTADPEFIEPVSEYYSQLLPIIESRQVSRGGNVILIQVENEYGAYGSDTHYLRTLANLIRGHGINSLLFTCDQANDAMLSRGTLPELLATGTFGSRSLDRLATLRRHQPTGPLMCTEYWDGWFDSWGRPHHTTDAEASARDLGELLGSGASVNLYMFHGGTNFGTTAGANDKGIYLPVTTSYDYDAPLGEDGHPRAKFAAYAAVIEARTGNAPAVPAAAPNAPTFAVTLRPAPSELPSTKETTGLLTIDDCYPNAVVAVYETAVSDDDLVLDLAEVRDRAWASLNGEPVGVLRRTAHERTLALPHRAGILRLVVEDRGRVNYGARIGEKKGLIGPARTATRTLDAWHISPVDLDAVGRSQAIGDALPPDAPVAGPVVLTADFDAEAGRDLYLDITAWGDGFVWLNGQALGRYSSEGPTRTMYVPGPLVHSSDNHLVVWELAGCSVPVARFLPTHDLGLPEE